MAWEPDYVTLAEAKAYLRISDTDDDALIPTWITTASRAVDTFCHRQFGHLDMPEARTFEGAYDAGNRWFAVEIDDLLDVTDLIVVSPAGAAVPWATALRPLNAPGRGRPYTRLLSSYATVVITARWGWPTVPLAVKNATLLQVARFAARRDSPYGIAGSPSEGSEQRLLATLDPDVKVSLGSRYRREWWVG